jgi:hypothetical protein
MSEGKFVIKLDSLYYFFLFLNSKQNGDEVLQKKNILGYLMMC